MVAQNFIENISSLNLGKQVDLNTVELQKIINKFPCFNSAYILQAIALKQESEEAFQEQLPNIASRVLNRAVLYDRVTYNYLEDKEVIDSQVAEVKAEEVTETKDEKEVEETETHTTEIIEEEVVEEKITEKETELTQQETNIAEENEIDNELTEILEQKEILENEATPKVEQTHAEELEDLSKLVKEVKAKSKKQAIVSKVKKSTIKKVSKSKNKNTEKEVTQSLSFTDWLKNKKSIDKTVSTPVKKVKEKPKEKIPIDMSASHEAALLMEAKKSSFKLEDFLVDQIERKQERKEKSKRDFTHAVSETYAKILVKQEKIKEAIDVYKELSIKYPKKSSNFAIQIEKLKNSL